MFQLNKCPPKQQKNANQNRVLVLKTLGYLFDKAMPEEFYPVDLTPELEEQVGNFQNQNDGVLVKRLEKMPSF